MATVSIEGTKEERSSWDHISAVATSIAAICSVGQFPLGSTGGVMYVGANKNIRVTLEKFGRVNLGDEGGQNLTTTS